MKAIRNCAKARIIRDDRLLPVNFSNKDGDFSSLPGGDQLHGFRSIGWINSYPQRLIACLGKPLPSEIEDWDAAD
ncbi:MAG: hypothetical protein PVF70_01800 [Anaerolineales bacterium]|jgi:hypothetical protein